MIPRAYFTHEIKGRTRLRIPSRKRDKTYFDQVERELEKIKNVDEVEVQPQTGSVLILHHGQRDELRSSLAVITRENRLFKLRFGRRSKKPWPSHVFGVLDRWDEEVMKATEGVWNLTSLAAVGLSAIGLYQATRKQLFPPAWALFDEAFRLLAENQRRRQVGLKSHR